MCNVAKIYMVLAEFETGCEIGLAIIPLPPPTMQPSATLNHALSFLSSLKQLVET